MAGARAKVVLLLQDETRARSGAALTENKILLLKDESRDRFLDGPTSRRIAVVDFDPETGRVTDPPAKFVASAGTPYRGAYQVDPAQPNSAAFIAVTVYGTVFETIRMFEEPGGMGRTVEWAFPGEQLLVVPRAGRWENAYYDRDSRSLQFFWFDTADGQRVYTALSRDIVAHECGHALIDAVVPSLRDTGTPESLAIHEACADLVAVLMALRSETLRTEVLARTNNSITDATEFSSIAERFGMSRPNPNRPNAMALRDLLNTNTMSSVDRFDHHELSTVLSGLFYETLVEMFERGKKRRLESTTKPVTEAVAANVSLGSVLTIFRRLLLRGIDYLPPGELTFADVGRATLAADHAADDTNPDKRGVRDRFADRFVNREIVTTVDDLQSARPQELAVDPKKLAALRDSDWAAYRFVEEHRNLLGIPKDVKYQVLDRIDATKEIGPKSSEKVQRELILKVAWDIVEENRAVGVPASKRRVRTGATLALRWSDGAVLALLGSNVGGRAQRENRDLFETRLVHSAVPVAVVDGADAAPRPGIAIHVVDGVSKITGTERLLHIQEMS